MGSVDTTAGIGHYALMPAVVDQEFITLLNDRDSDGLPTEVVLRDGQHLLVHNIAWGYDMGDVHAHVTTNCNIPTPSGAPLDFFFTSEVVSVIDPATQRVLMTPTW